jgi:hypothetical protein
MTAATMRHALNAVGNIPDTPPTHTAYTPVWDWEGKKFGKWLPIGSLWQHTEHNVIIGKIDMLPINPEENFTGFFHAVPVGAAKPAPLTMTKDEFVEAQFARQ